MENRVKVKEQLPEVWKAMYTFAHSLDHATLTPVQKELIKVRASQMNSCAFCINMHVNAALKAGETAQRLFLLSAWRETDIFSEDEKAMLALTEEVTFIDRHGVSAGVYAEAERFFSAQVIAEIIICVVIINSWNRIMVAGQTPIEG